MKGTALVTGADGYLGLHATRALLEDGWDVVAWVRAADAGAARAKEAGLRRRLGADKPDRLRVAHGQLGQGGALRGAAQHAQDVTAIVHAAGIARFNVERGLARQVNVGGTTAALAYARSCPGLRQFVFLGSLFAAGLRTGRIPEERLDDAAGFANHYEWSKWAGEEAVHDAAAEGAPGVPATVLRIPTVICDDASGRAGQQNAFHNTLRLLRHGLLSVLPGRPETPMYFTTAAFAARAVAELCVKEGPQGVIHVTHGIEGAPTLQGLMDMAFARFAEDAAFARRQVMRPLYCDLASFQEVAGAWGPLAGGVLGEALSSIAPFAPQLFLRKEPVADRCRRVLGIEAPDGRELADATCAQLMRPMERPHAA